ncbi:hypothetical protein [Nitrosopumilus adriaticus]|uniref:Uncharacterized protein n=1 Tax=Nitrosopumilus adriaticus TaxID=1580092 RepID=A0A0D5C3T2_9ARCH|nr:hypothetical protein [Nitrosopumilus adriaticus]AJW71062.1 hypothetical protein NADRNF5_1376 [Nitrosopumilus adriaticus]
MTKINKELLDFKGSPKIILESLQIFQKHPKQWEKIQQELIQMAIKKEIKAIPRVIISAYITPMLRNLKLIYGEGTDIKITNDGTQCIEAFLKNSEEGYKKRLAYQTIKIDEENIRLIPYLMRHHNKIENSVSLNDLKDELFSIGVPNAKKPTPVGSWIQLLTFVELVFMYNKKFYVRESQYETMLKGENKPKKSDIEKAFKNAANVLKSPNTSYVSIPEFRDQVCEELRISSFTFYNILKNNPYSIGKTRLMFATPIKKTPGGIIIGNKYYYFISVYP